MVLHDLAAQVLPDPGVAVVPIVAVHGAQVRWGKVVVGGLPVVSARRLPSMLRELPAVLAPERVAALAKRWAAFASRHADTNTSMTCPTGRPRGRHGDVVDLDPTLGQELLDVAVRQRKAQVPAHCQDDHLWWEAEAGKGRRGDDWTARTTGFHVPVCLRGIRSQQMQQPPGAEGGGRRFRFGRPGRTATGREQHAGR
jgi:hypothetical protein